MKKDEKLKPEEEKKSVESGSVFESDKQVIKKGNSQVSTDHEDATPPSSTLHKNLLGLSRTRRLLNVCMSLVNPRNWYNSCKYVIKNFPVLIRTLIGFVTFFIILITFLIGKGYELFERIPFVGRIFTKAEPVIMGTIGKPFTLFILRLEALRSFQVRRSYLIQMAYHSLSARASRTAVTIFGMAAGVGIIVYLLSLGYGIERLVINQVASLDELQIVDVSASENTALKINNDTVKKFGGIKEINTIHPLISLVGRINFNKAQADVLVYAADAEFLELSKVAVKKGRLFTEELGANLNSFRGRSQEAVAGASTTDGSYLMPRSQEFMSMNILPTEQAPVWESCDISSELLGYTHRQDTFYDGILMWGSTYHPFGEGGREAFDSKKDMYLGNWVMTKVPIFVRDSEDALIPLIGQDGYHTWEIGCIQEKFVQIQESDIPKVQFGDVLGETSDSITLAQASPSADLTSRLALQGTEATGSAVPAYISEVVSTDSAGVEYVTLQASDSAGTKKKQNIAFEEPPLAQAVISTGLMKILGISEKDIIGAKFDVSFIIAEALLPGIDGRVFSNETEYEIVGLIDDDEQQYFYVSLNDMSKLGLTNFSQLKVVVNDKNGMPKVRTQIETFGYNTASAADTVEQIEALFANVRIVLGSIGLVALAVASLGMFNTMTVSLLERTREIGGMKVIGMVSGEIQDLFLAEGMIMGFSGGLGGLLLGYALGFITSSFASIFSIAQGLGYLKLTYIPPAFTLSILLLSFVVGIVTGLYPAHRAKNISALNALRYE